MSQVFSSGSKLEDIFEHSKTTTKVSKLLWMGTQAISNPDFDLK